MAKQNLLPENKLQLSYAAEVLQAFKKVLITNGFDDNHQLSQMKLYALESDQIIVHLQHANKTEILSISWRKHLANLAALNIYHHN